MIVPAKNWLVCKTVTKEITSGPLIIVSTKEPQVKYAEVLGVGAAVTDYSVGQIVIFSKHVGHEVDGQHLVDSDDVLGRLA